LLSTKKAIPFFRLICQMNLEYIFDDLLKSHSENPFIDSTGELVRLIETREPKKRIFST
jgi:hypothetical protein